MRQSYFIYTFYIVIFLCCKPQVASITKYEASALLDIKVYWMFKGKKKFVLGNTLSLNSVDSTFNFTTCGCETRGRWKIMSDTLFLDHQEVGKIHDSIVCYTPHFYKKWYGNQWIGRNEGETIEVLKKNE